MSSSRRVQYLGVQPVPQFARRVTLHQAAFYRGIGGEPEPGPFLLTHSDYNIAALAFWPRGGGGVGTWQLALSRVYYSHTASAGVTNIFGVTPTVVPAGAEFFSVAWLKPPDSWLNPAGTIYLHPEDYFWCSWELAL